MPTTLRKVAISQIRNLMYLVRYETIQATLHFPCNCKPIRRISEGTDRW